MSERGRRSEVECFLKECAGVLLGILNWDSGAVVVNGQNLTDG